MTPEKARNERFANAEPRQVGSGATFLDAQRSDARYDEVRRSIRMDGAVLCERCGECFEGINEFRLRVGYERSNFRRNTGGGERAGELCSAPLEYDGDRAALDLDVVEADLNEQRGQFLGVRESPRPGPVTISKFVVDGLADGIAHRREHGRVADFGPHGDAETAAGAERALHLGERRLPVGEELQTLLADRGIEAPGGHRQVVSRRLEILDRRSPSRSRLGARELEHRWAEVAPDHPSIRPDAFRGESRHRARPAGYVEHRLTRFKVEL